MGDLTATASAHEVIAVEPVIRRVVAARAANHADVDDLVQDCLERLLMARERLTPESVLPYAVVTARNLASSHAKRAMRHAAAAPRILDAAEPERPDEVLLAGEARDAMMAALAPFKRRGHLPDVMTNRSYRLIFARWCVLMARIGCSATRQLGVTNVGEEQPRPGDFCHVGTVVGPGPGYHPQAVAAAAASSPALAAGRCRPGLGGRCGGRLAG